MDSAERLEGAVAGSLVPPVERRAEEAAGAGRVASGERPSRGCAEQAVASAPQGPGEDGGQRCAEKRAELLRELREYSIRTYRANPPLHITFLDDPHGYYSKHGWSGVQKMIADGELIEYVSPWRAVTLDRTATALDSSS